MSLPMCLFLFLGFLLGYGPFFSLFDNLFVFFVFVLLPFSYTRERERAVDASDKNDDFFSM